MSRRNGGGHRAKFYVGNCVGCHAYYVAADPNCPPKCPECEARVGWSPRFKVKTPEYVYLPPPARPLTDEEAHERYGRPID